MYSSRRFLPLADEIARELRGTVGLEWLDTPRFVERLRRYSIAAAQLELLEAWIDQIPFVEAASVPMRDGGTQTALDLQLDLMATVHTWAKRCGLYPSVGADVQADIDASLRTVVKRREREALQAALLEDVGKQMAANPVAWTIPWKRFTDPRGQG
ncbi:hypothetical protein [Leifsonia poae]|uniref:hypothetical protein n=1 Tax=Leifsonia poae TaxID=110933 RepID=UPI003D67E2F2